MPIRAAFPAEAAEFEAFTHGKIPQDFAADVPKWKPADKAIATRVAGGEVHERARQSTFHNLMGGSADLNPSTNTALKGTGDFQPVVAGGASNMGAVGGGWGYAGRNVAFGVREHAHGSRGERHGRARRSPAVRRYVPRLFRLHEAVDPALGAQPAEEPLGIHARQHRRWRRWPHA